MEIFGFAVLMVAGGLAILSGIGKLLGMGEVKDEDIGVWAVTTALLFIGGGLLVYFGIDWFQDTYDIIRVK